MSSDNKLSESLLSEEEAGPSRPATDTISRMQRRMRWFGMAVSAFWLLAIGCLVVYARFHAVFLIPKAEFLYQNQDPENLRQTVNGLAQLLQVTLYVTHYAWMLLAAVFGIGTLATCAFLYLSRRTTLRQVNLQLAEITEILRALEADRVTPNESGGG